MNKQAFGRACLSLFSILALSIGLAACGGSDEGGDSIKSPDLPKPQVTAVRVSCGADDPDVISVGESRQCEAECDIRSVDKDGDATTTTRDCTGDVAWRTDCEGLEINNQGVASGVSPDMCNVFARKDDVRSPDERVDVRDAQLVCAEVYPTSVTPPEPNEDCTNATDRSVTVPLGVQVAFNVAIRLDNGSTCYFPNAPAGKQACPENISQTFISSNTDVAVFNNANDGVANTVGTGSSDITTDSSVNMVMLTVEDAVLNSELCVTPQPLVSNCQSFSQDVVDCGTQPDVTLQATFAGDVPEEKQFFATAFFNLGDGDSNNNVRCDVTFSADTDWTIENGPGELTNSSVSDSDDPLDKGRVTAGDTVGTDLVVATFTQGADSATGNDSFNIVDELVLANNSLIATATPISSDPAEASPTRAACIGTYDLVAGLAEAEELPAERGFFAAVGLCPESELDGDGNCQSGFVNPLQDGTNDEAGNNPLDGTVTWELKGGYWDGSQCATATGADPEDAPTSAFLGDNDAGDRYSRTPSPAFGESGATDARVFASPDMEDNGVAESDGVVNLATNCIEVTYTAADSDGVQRSSTDGITLIVLPITNDSLLTDPDSSGAVELCNSLVPLFNLGASEGGANGAVLQAVNAVATLLDPVTSGLDENVPLDDVLTQVIAALEPVTGPLSEAALTDILTAANDNVFEPLNCAIGEILKGLATQDPSQTDIEACAP